LICAASLRPSSDRPKSIILPQFRAEISRQRSFNNPLAGPAIIPARLAPSSCWTHPSRLCGSNRGTTPSARDKSSDRRPCGSRQPLGGDQVKHLDRSLLDAHDNAVDVPGQRLVTTTPDRQRARSRRQPRPLRPRCCVWAANVDPDRVFHHHLIGIVHSCPYCMQTTGEPVTVVVCTHPRRAP
jgi:hypothetical protein